MMPTLLNFLIVDDIPSTRRLVVQELELMGFVGAKVQADNTASAIDIIQKRQNTFSPIHFVVSDLELGENSASGLELLLWLRHDLLLFSLPFMMVTKISDRASIISAISLGVSNYLLKPWNRNDFQKRVYSTWAHVGGNYNNSSVV